MKNKRKIEIVNGRNCTIKIITTESKRNLMVVWDNGFKYCCEGQYGFKSLLRMKLVKLLALKHSLSYSNLPYGVKVRIRTMYITLNYFKMKELEFPKFT